MKRMKHRIRKRDKVATVYFPVFSNYEVKIVFTHDFKKAMKRFEHTQDVDPIEHATGMTVNVEDGEQISYIFILYGQDVDIMVHEAYHVVRNIMETFQAEQTNEVMAYHLAYLTQKIVELARA